MYNIDLERLFDGLKPNPLPSESLVFLSKASKSERDLLTAEISAARERIDKFFKRCKAAFRVDLPVEQLESELQDLRLEPIRICDDCIHVESHRRTYKAMAQRELDAYKREATTRKEGKKAENTAKLREMCGGQLPWNWEQTILESVGEELQIIQWIPLLLYPLPNGMPDPLDIAIGARRKLVIELLGFDPEN